ncbi:MAG: Fe-S cluster assembly ATPase SufC [Candidatus Moranbacteria bacterium]|nr:Fe-S cluster assembly ATPase SufC [Candidatus Moranbacteria bacterium]
MLELKNLTASAGDKTILDNINFSFDEGLVYALLGPNGSGKSTLASSIMGHPNFTLSPDSCISFEGEDITGLSADKRAKKGIFLSFQSPVPLPGVSIYQLMRHAFENKVDALTSRKKIQAFAKELDIKDELLTRSLNDDFSGGEKKKMEVLQMAMLEPKLAIFDEIDTGVDVDALKTIAQFLKKHRNPGQTFIFITHSVNLLKTILPDTTIVLKKGAVTKQGDGAMAMEIIETEGFEEKKEPAIR